MTQRDDYDSPWKEMLEAYFPDFLAFFFPALHAAIDWSRGYQSLDAELQQIVHDATLGRRFADKLFQVWRHDGSPQMVLIHVEVQGQRDPEFPERMYVYNYRTFDRYRCLVLSLAVLADTSRSWRPDCYSATFLGHEVLLKFLMVKLRDYWPQWHALAAHPNPFAVITRAHLQAQRTRRHPAQRLQAKVTIIRQMYRRGFARQQILDMFRFIDWVMRLPTALDRQLQTTLAQIEAETQMPYITSIERLSLEQGRQEGRQEGEAIVLTRLLTQRFGPLPSWAVARLTQANLADLEQWTERLLAAQRLEEVVGQP